jgi:primosomal protein N' (replication factor Y)
MILYADVVLPLPLERPYTYSVPPELVGKIGPGFRVLVPLGERRLVGFVVRIRKRKPDSTLKLKAILEVLDGAPFFSLPFLSFTRRLSSEFFAPWGEVLQVAVPTSFLLKTKTSISLTMKGKDALARGLLSEEERQVAALLATRPHSPRFLERKHPAKSLSSLLARLEKRGWISVQKKTRGARRKARVAGIAKATQLELDFSLDSRLREAAKRISTAAAQKRFAPFLLFGSAARREAVYFQLIRDALASAEQVLYLIPEISLTPALLEKLEKRLGEQVAVLHSRMTEKKRELEWEKIRERRADVVVGPRSALFSPLDRVKLIILDEEQDETYSQQEGLPYDVRVGARLRAEDEKAVLIYGSDRPTIETFYRAQKGRYLIDLGHEPKKANISLIDSRKDPGVVSRQLRQAIERRLESREPVLLFFNRRGYASHLVCGRCGFVPRCTRCDLALAYHKKENQLICHACRAAMPVPPSCPQCGGSLAAKRGMGIEAVAEELKRVFPRARIAIFATDEAYRKDEKKNLIEDLRKGEIDILVGTQLLAHQSGLTPVSLVGIIHPELILHLSDFRSGQMAFQAIGRALCFLRESGPAEALIQTAAPDHFSIQEAARGDYWAFYEKEIKFRRLMDYPPFSSLAEVVLAGENLRKVAASARSLAAGVKNAGAEIQVFGPSLASMARRRGLFRVQVSLKARTAKTLRKVLPLVLREIHSKRFIFLFD